MKWIFLFSFSIFTSSVLAGGNSYPGVVNLLSTDGVITMEMPYGTGFFIRPDLLGCVSQIFQMKSIITNNTHLIQKNSFSLA